MLRSTRDVRAARRLKPAGEVEQVLAVRVTGKDSQRHFSDTALGTPSSGTSVHLLSGLYSFIVPAIRVVFAPKLR
jgi:hypothetical protein